MKNFYGLVALMAGAVMIAPAQAQAQTLTDWMACMDLWADESICGPQPADEPAPQPEPEPEPEPGPTSEPDPEPAPEPEPDQDASSHAAHPSIPDAASDKGKLQGQRGIDTAHQAQQGHSEFGHSHSGEHGATSSRSGRSRQ